MRAAAAGTYTTWYATHVAPYEALVREQQRLMTNGEPLVQCGGCNLFWDKTKGGVKCCSCDDYLTCNRPECGVAGWYRCIAGCEGPFCEQCAVSCNDNDCEVIACRSCSFVCDECDTATCPECTVECDACNDSTCVECSVYCQDCTALLCTDCTNGSCCDAAGLYCPDHVEFPYVCKRCPDNPLCRSDVHLCLQCGGRFCLAVGCKEDGKDCCETCDQSN